MIFVKPFHIDLGIDLGTANTIVFALGRGFIINEASYIALNQNGKTVALGNAAKEMMGRTPESIRVIRPLSDGVISDFSAGEALIRGFIKSAGIPRFRISRVLIGIPTGATEVEKRAMIESAKVAGAKKVFLIAEPMAAAIGLGVDIMGPTASMIVDIGGGTTDIAVINYGGIVVDNTIRIAGDDLDEAIVNYLRRQYNIKMGSVTAERLKIKVATLTEKPDEDVFSFKSLDFTGTARRYEFPVMTFRKAVKEVIEEIVSAILQVLEVLPAELSSDLISCGIILTGGGSMLPGLDALISEKTGLHITIPDNPLYSVAMGTQKILTNFKYYDKVLIRHY